MGRYASVLRENSAWSNQYDKVLLPGGNVNSGLQAARSYLYGGYPGASQRGHERYITQRWLLALWGFYHQGEDCAPFLAGGNEGHKRDFTISIWKNTPWLFFLWLWSLVTSLLERYRARWRELRGKTIKGRVRRAQREAPGFEERDNKTNSPTTSCGLLRQGLGVLYGHIRLISEPTAGSGSATWQSPNQAIAESEASSFQILCITCFRDSMLLPCSIWFQVHVHEISAGFAKVKMSIMRKITITFSPSQYGWLGDY